MDSLDVFADSAVRSASGRNGATRKDELTFKANLKKGRHGWLRLTPAYSLHLVEEIVSRLEPSAVVLDPFCGTGTTGLVCVGRGLACETIDINPFLVWLARTKARSYSAGCLAEFDRTVASVLEKCRRNAASAWIPPIHEIEKWWHPRDLARLARIADAVKVASVSPEARDLLSVAFCRASIQCANVSFGHQSMSFRRTSCEGDMFSADETERLTDAMLDESFRSVRDAAAVHPGGGSLAVHLGDSREVGRSLRPASVDAVITSPPYPNRMSYIRELRPYMYWMGYLANGREAGELDWKAIGGTWGCATSNLSKWSPDPQIPIPHDGFETTLEGIGGRSRLLATYVRKYFEDMVLHFRSLVPVLRPGARLHYIVGNSKFYDTMLHVERIYASLMESAGLVDVEIECIRKRTSKKELFEFAVRGAKP